MKSKLSTIILILYSLILILLSCNSTNINNLVLGLVVKLNVSNINLCYNIIYYCFLVIVYIGYSITLTLVCIEYIKEFKYIVIYSLLLNILTIIIINLIKSFFDVVDIYKIIASLISILIGLSIQIFIKIKQIKGGRYEK